MSQLGKLEPVTNIRTEWADEARDFTPWLAQPESLALLGETLGFGEDRLEFVEMEAAVGRFAADILCRDSASEDQFVIIENQFGRTDHDHLGKLLTYAAGRKAKTVIWIAEHLRDEHRAAIDMLNDATSEDYQFFALEIELWRIGDSPIAPRFNVIAKPNDWSRHVKQVNRTRVTTELSPLKQQNIRYWTVFKECLADNSKIAAQKASPQQWIFMPIGRSNFTLTASVNSRENWIMACLELHQDDAPAYFQLLERQRTEIETECPFDLTWEPLPKRKGARIEIKLTQTDPTNETDWPRQHRWLVEHLSGLKAVFKERILALDLADLEHEV